MKITTTKRNEFDTKAFMGGSVGPEVIIDPISGDATYQDEIAKGVVVNGCWYELPDEPDGEYVLIETLRTNHYGFYENGGSERALITRAEADTLDQRVMRGIVDQLAVIRVSGDDVQCDYDERNLIRKQGV